MQETCNNCFGSKICSTALHQAKTGKHECRNITAMYVAVIFQCGVIIQSVIQSFLKMPVCGAYYLMHSKVGETKTFNNKKSNLIYFT